MPRIMIVFIVASCASCAGKMDHDAESDREVEMLRVANEKAQIALAGALAVIDDYERKYGPLSLDGGLRARVIHVVDRRHVVVDVGSWHGIRPGNILHERNRSHYVGRLRVLEVTENTATAELIDATSEGEQPCICDDVYE